MKLIEHTFKITGLTPLLMHAPTTMRAGAPAMKSKKIPTPEEEAKLNLYVASDGTFYIPSIAFRSALLYAVAGKKVGKRGAKGIISAAVFNLDEHSTVLNPKTSKPLTEYKIDTRRAVVGKAGIMRSRPRFEAWGCNVTFQIDEDLVTPELIRENLNEAGIMAGVGDYRVNKGGPFGRFKADKI